MFDCRGVSDKSTQLSSDRLPTRCLNGHCTLDVGRAEWLYCLPAAVGMRVLFMSGDGNEVKEYLRYLLDHNGECRTEGCASCHTLDNVCEHLRYQIFSGSVYPEIMTPPTSRATSLH
jgi:hypothetical protein